jgi:deoxyadenosine/deoxycytidine kinase
MSYCTIEGNIGSGKSTLVRKIEDKIRNVPDFKIKYALQEPVQEWLDLKDSDGENILSKFYEDTPRWAYSFQMNAFITRSKDIVDKRKLLEDGKWMVGERSVLTDRNVFAKLLNESGKISLLEWELYNNWYQWLLNDYNLKPDIIFYLYVSAETSYDRLLKRNREEETGITIEYMRDLSTKHIEWLVPEDKRHKLEEKDWTYFELEHPSHRQIIVLNGNIDLADREDYYDELVDIIINKL